MLGKEPSFRIKGGTQQLINKLVAEVGMENIALDQPISKLKKQDTHVEIISKNGGTISSEVVISTIPSKLFDQSIECTPALHNATLEVFKNTQIWMEGSVKFALEFESPFCKKKGWS